VSPRCPFATVHRCPRYYQSVWLLGQSGVAMQIASTQDDVLLNKCRESDLWPATAEQEPIVMSGMGGIGGKDPAIFNRFCPEVAYDRFEWFATYLSRYSDEIDLQAAHARLGRDRVSRLARACRFSLAATQYLAQQRRWSTTATVSDSARRTSRR
jgi:hypothetical protein